MRWDFGSIYQSIRRSKGLSQSSVCGNFLSRTTLSKIENNHEAPHFETMLFLLEQIDMDIEEFIYICNSYQPQLRQEILTEFRQLTVSMTVEKLEKLRTKCEQYLASHHDVPIKHHLNILEIYLHLKQHGFKQETAQYNNLNQELWSYLKKQDTWYLNDLKLLHALLPSIPVEQVLTFTDKILNSLEKYQTYKDIYPAKFAILANLSSLFLYHGHMKNCQKISQLTLEVAQKTKRYDQLAFAKIRLGICQQDNELISNGIRILQLTNEVSLLDSMKKDIKSYHQT